ncbi:hypothetical protein ACLM5J_06770 [Nocardioides sp. Bht2]|uniref:hypothetical protein n=1 Tax=Nocardioides sp. Bht2 TaxID=3392297 RepID=UPI0039B42C47
MKRSYIGLAAAMMSAFGLSFGIGAASAAPDNLVPTGNPISGCGQGFSVGGACQTDNKNVYWHMADGGAKALETNDRVALKAMLDDQFQGPMNLTYDSTPAFTGSAETDWIFQEDSPGPGLAGYVWCNDKIGTWRCDQHYIMIDTGAYLNPKITCHETGHAVGLTHGDWATPSTANNASSLGCLRGPYSAITSNALGANNKAQIAAVYN